MGTKKAKKKVLRVSVHTHKLYKIRAAEEDITIDELARRLIEKK